MTKKDIEVLQNIIKNDSCDNIGLCKNCPIYKNEFVCVAYDDNMRIERRNFALRLLLKHNLNWILND